MIGKDRKHLRTWKKNGWRYFNLARMIIILALVLTFGGSFLMIVAFAAEDQSPSDYLFIFYVFLIFVGGLALWLCGLAWVYLHRDYHSLLTKHFWVDPSTMMEE